MESNKVANASFRDPSGFVYESGGIIYRQVNHSYAENYSRLMDSGLYQRLVDKQLLIPHTEVEQPEGQSAEAFRTLRPERIDYISYPYEWCFSQLQDAALATLEVQKIALQFGMSLKDANGFNIQFYNGKPVLIDTLSFEAYVENQPWVAYRQFCQHFLAPVLLISQCDYGLIKLLRTHIDGIPLGLASKILPRRSWLKYSVLSHIHLHARAQQRYSDSAADGSSTEAARQARVSKLGLMAMIDSLRSVVRKAEWQPGKTEWGDYYSDTNYADTAMQHKLKLVAEFVNASGRQDQLVIDMGANTGRFSRAVMEHGHRLIAQDIDELAVERCYQQARESKETRICPLVQDLTNPSPRLGWAHEERMSLLDRGPADTVLALALIHHLAIANNTPLDRCARFFSTACEHLVIEFVPKSDSQVKRLLATREDIFSDYDKPGFERAFGQYFDILKCEAIDGSDRHLYLMKSAQR